MSFGNVVQSLSLDTDQLTLVLGENLDLPGAAGNSRNGVGKSSILNAICFALYGQALSNIRKDNLINLTNEKGMYVSLEFERNTVKYRIERGRKPNFFKFYIDDKQVEDDAKTNEKDESQGESRETQKEIEKVVGFSPELFKQIVGLNTLSLPFLSLPTKDQRNLIEELLGITQLSEKAEGLKEMLRQTKDMISEEEIKIKTIRETNEKVQKSIDDLRKRSSRWVVEHQEQITAMEEKIQSLLELDVEKEIQFHKDYTKSTTLRAQLAKLERDKKPKENALRDYEKRKKQYDENLSTAEKHSCPTCGQGIHEQQQEEIRTGIIEKLKDVESTIAALEKEIGVFNHEIENITKEMTDIGTVTKPFYPNIDDAYNHRSKLEGLAAQLEKMMEAENPFDDHIISQQENLLQKIDVDTIQELTVLREHQDFLLKLLTSKDSAVRKLIIDQNLSYLNYRLSHYVEKLGLPHTVTFVNDLSVTISEHGRELDFDNLSRGEKTRLILGLSFAFRDVFESFNSTINLLFLDEIVDMGLDGAGLEYALELLKKMSRELNRCIFLVSHREELLPRVNNILYVVKENGFSSIIAGDINEQAGVTSVV